MAMTTKSAWGQPKSNSHSPSDSRPSAITTPATATPANYRSIQITVTNGLQSPEAFLQSLEASSGRIQRAAIQFLSQPDVSIEDVVGVNEDANANAPNVPVQSHPPKQTSGQTTKEAAARVQGQIPQEKRVHKLKIEFNTVQAANLATLAISRLSLNGLNDIHIDTDNNDNNQLFQSKLLAQRRNPQSKPVRTVTVQARIVEPKEAREGVEGEEEGEERVENDTNNTLDNVQATSTSTSKSTSTAGMVEAAELVAVQPLSGFILDDNDHLLDFRGYSVNNLPVDSWGKPTASSSSSKIDGGYGDSRQSVKVREDGQNSQTAQSHYGASPIINGNIIPLNNFISSPSYTSQPSQRDAVTSATNETPSSAITATATGPATAFVAAPNGNVIDKRILTNSGAMTHKFSNPAAPTAKSPRSALSAGSVESEDYYSSSATPSTASSSSDMENTHNVCHSRRESVSSFAFSLPSDSSPTIGLGHQLMMEQTHHSHQQTSKLFPSIGMGANHASGAFSAGLPTMTSAASATNPGMGMGWGTKTGFSGRSTTSASGASHTPSSSLSSLSSFQHDQCEQYDQHQHQPEYQYDPYGHYEYDAFDDEFDQVVALGLDLSRLEVIDPASQRTPTEWRARDNIFTSPSTYNNMNMGSWVQPISKPQLPLLPLTLPTLPTRNANVNAKAYASVATAGITRTGTITAEPERSPLPYIHHPQLAQGERKNIQTVAPSPPPSSHSSHSSHSSYASYASYTSQPQHQYRQPSPPQQKQNLSSPQYTKVVHTGNSPVSVSPATNGTGMIKADGFVKPAASQASGSGPGPNKRNPAGQHRPTYSTSTNYSRHSDASISSSSPSTQNHKGSNYKQSQSHSKPSQSPNMEKGNGSGNSNANSNGNGNKNESDDGKKYHKSRQDKRLYSADPHVGPRPTDWMLSEETKRTRAIRDARFAQIVSMGLAPGRTKAGWAQARRPGKRDRDAAKARLRAMEEDKERERLQALLNDEPSPAEDNFYVSQPQPQPQTA